MIFECVNGSYGGFISIIINEYIILHQKGTKESEF